MIKNNLRFEFHFTPVHCSWMNQVKQWFSILKRKRLTISNFESKDDLKRNLYCFIEQWNEKTKIKLEKFIQKIENKLDKENFQAA